MASVGVRELRQRASELLRRVAAGETIEVTDRGRPVALLSPLPEVGPLERLRADLRTWQRDTRDPRAAEDDDRWDKYPYFGEPAKK